MKNECQYRDPPNTSDIIEELKNCATMGEVNTLINRVFPNWNVGVLTEFCKGYPHLTNNWKTLCNRLNLKPTQIFIVRELSFDKEHTLLRHFMECLTRSGFAVKRMSDFVPCTKCEKIAVPTPQIHNLMKEKNIPVPEINIPICMSCR